jgi:antitoxin ParD1/3/4
MGKANTSFALGEQWDEYLREQVQSGLYSSASEVVREALRAHRERGEREAQLDAALKKGLASPASPLSHDEVWTKLRERHPWLKK